MASVESIQIKTEQLKIALEALRQAILQAGRDGKLSLENFDDINGRLGGLVQKISTAQVNLPQFDLKERTTVLEGRLDSYFEELDQIGASFGTYAGLGNPVSKYRAAVSQKAPFTLNPFVKWGLIIGVGALAFKFLWSRAAPEYPRGQLPRYAGGQRGDD